MIDKIKHYSLEYPGTIYDEEAMTVLELVGRTAHKVNEVIEDQNSLHGATQGTLAQVDAKLAAQDEDIKKVREETVPQAVADEVNDHIQSGDFDRAISEYANNLEARLNNLVTSLREGSTTMDAEVIDLRVDATGTVHNSAGDAVRSQTAAIKAMSEEASRTGGVYAIPIDWYFSAGYYTHKAMAIPVHGISVRVSENKTVKVGGKDCKIYYRVYLGYMVDGEFVADNDLSTLHTGGKNGLKLFYIPHMDGVFFRVTAMLWNGSGNVLTADNYREYSYIPGELRVYTGQISGGGNLIGYVNSTLKVVEPEGYEIQWGLTGWAHKFASLTSPLPLKYVNRVVCNPDRWLGAKVYKFDPATRTTTWIETKHFHNASPCFGSECVIDFSEYGDNYYAILTIGVAPIWADYSGDGYTSKTQTANTIMMGLDLSAIVAGVHVDWCAGANIRSNILPGNPVVQRNIDLLQNLKHRVVAGMYGREPGQYNYTLGQREFAGTFYGGGYSQGCFFYNVSPRAYYTALLNPNSVAYGDSDETTQGHRYGLVCGSFVALMHGYPMPLSVFNFRYSDLPWFYQEKLNLTDNLYKLKAYDVLSQPAGTTGHSVLLTDIVNVCNIATGLKVMESAAPATKENVFLMHNGAPFYKSNPEDYFPAEYSWVAFTDPAYDAPLHDRADWSVPYTTPQKVMCSRGYGGIYIKGPNTVQLSVDPEVNNITIAQDGKTVGTFVVDDLLVESKNGYKIVDITSKVNTGTVTVRNNMDTGVEEFYVVDPAGCGFTATLNDDRLEIQATNVDRIKFLNIKYRYVDGDYAGNIANVLTMPKFTEAGFMAVPSAIETDLGTLNLECHNAVSDYRNYVNVVYTTEYDTNTFAVTGMGDVIL